MDWGKTITKAGLAALTFLVAMVASNPQIIVNLIPDNIASMTIGSAVAALIVGFSNWLKNKNA